MRPDLPQEIEDPSAHGQVGVYHSNEWNGSRLTGQHWRGDLPPEVAHSYLGALTVQLKSNGWDFSPECTKILMLTHKVLAAEQGYEKLAEVFSSNDAFIQKQDPYIAFFIDILVLNCIN